MSEICEEYTSTDPAVSTSQWQQLSGLHRQLLADLAAGADAEAAAAAVAAASTGDADVEAAAEAVATAAAQADASRSQVWLALTRRVEAAAAPQGLNWAATSCCASLVAVLSKSSGAAEESPPRPQDDADADDDAAADAEAGMAASLDFHSMVTSMLPDDAGDALDSDRVSTEALVQQLKSLLECGDGGSGSDSDAAAEEVDEVDGAAAADYQLPGGVGGVLLSPSQQELLQFRAENGEDLSQLSAGALNEYLNELECLISELNDTLVTELARRDELALDREVKEQFINLLTAVQAKKRESRQQLHQQHQQPQHMAFTTLPLRKRGLSDTEHLQTLNGILRAMLLNAPEVSSLLTDYILRVYAPILPEA